MRTSENIEQLALALSLAQAEFGTAKKSGRNPFYKNAKHPDGSPYSTLEDINDATKDALAKNHIAVIQSPSMHEGRLIMTTRLIHKSGQWIEDDLSLKPAQDTPQVVGGTCTYARRYQKAAMLGVSSDEDDDGNVATGLTGNEKPRGNYKPKIEEPKISLQESLTPKKFFNKDEPSQKEWLESKIKIEGISNEDGLVIIEELHGKDILTELQPLLKRFKKEIF